MSGPGRILLTDAAASVLRRLSPVPRRKIRAALKRLADGHGDLDVKPLQLPPGQPPAWRLRVGDFRIVFDRSGRQVRVFRIFHRSQGYAWLEPT